MIVYLFNGETLEEKSQLPWTAILMQATPKVVERNTCYK